MKLSVTNSMGFNTKRLQLSCANIFLIPLKFLSCVSNGVIKIILFNLNY